MLIAMMNSSFGQTQSPPRDASTTMQSTSRQAANQDLLARNLRAGPITLKFQDGELRYLRVGEKEIIRRIYFGVRDGQWNTATPRFTAYTVDAAADQFSVKLSAICQLDKLDYHWDGTITGTADGKITFHVSGEAMADFGSNRIGLCVLYGADSLIGQHFETVAAEKGMVTKGQFPDLVLNKLVAERFITLRYTTPQQISVNCSATGSTFDMEDQRNWGDTSYKAYAPLRYTYPKIKKGQKQEQTVTLAVAAPANLPQPEAGPVQLKLTDRVIGKLPSFVPVGSIRNAVGFSDISFKRNDYNEAKVVIWSYIGTEHLIDNDTIMENVPAVCMQARTLHSFAQEAQLRVGPSLRKPKPREGRDPRAATPFAAAWVTAMMKYLACGRVDETAFDLGPGYSTHVLDIMREQAGKEILEVESDHRMALPPVAFAVRDENGTSVWIVNRTDTAAAIVLDGISSSGSASLMRINSKSPADVKPAEQELETRASPLQLELAPYETVRLVIPKP